MEQFYVLAIEDYRQIAISFDWVSWLKERERRAAPRAVHLLDVACGSGKFPSALQEYTSLASAQLKPIRYDLLDPTSFSLEEARGVLRPPFNPGEEYQCRLQDLEGESLRFDIVWAVHALYALPPGELQDGLERLVGALGPEGTGFIAHACENAHYLQFYRVYLDRVKQGKGTPYASAEQITETLRRLGVACETRDIHYECRTPLDNTSAVEGYLQRCLFDSTISLDDMRKDRALGQYLEGCRDAEGWRFRQHVKMIFIAA
ncbi:MAG: class I SAM-dependent methyltransferase [Alphaproteobacteria bacterium]|nr:class I SAM-dependent methyltransferase [Alphaproteobacteria bacterium]